MSPQEIKKNIKSLIVGEETWRPQGHLRLKIVIVGSNKWVKNHLYLTVLLYTARLGNISPLANSTSVNNCYVKYVKLLNLALFIGPTATIYGISISSTSGVRRPHS